MGWRAVGNHPNGQDVLQYRHAQLQRAQRPFRGSRLKVLRRYARDRKVLDVGCVSHNFHFASGGGGRWLHDHIRRVAAECVGTDYDEVGIKEMRDAGYDVVHADITGDVSALRERGPFEVIIAGEIIEHLAAPQLLLQSCRDLLAPGGTVVLSTPNPFAPRRARMGALGHTWENVDHVAYLFPSGVAELADRTGLQLKRFGTVGWPNEESVASMLVDSMRELLRAARQRATGKRAQRRHKGRFNLPVHARWLSPLDVVIHAARRRGGMLGETAIYILTKPTDA